MPFLFTLAHLHCIKYICGRQKSLCLFIPRQANLLSILPPSWIILCFASASDLPKQPQVPAWRPCLEQRSPACPHCWFVKMSPSICPRAADPEWQKAIRKPLFDGPQHNAGMSRGYYLVMSLLFAMVPDRSADWQDRGETWLTQLLCFVRGSIVLGSECLLLPFDWCIDCHLAYALSHGSCHWCIYLINPNLGDAHSRADLASALLDELGRERGWECGEAVLSPRSARSTPVTLAESLLL